MLTYLLLVAAVVSCVNGTPVPESTSSGNVEELQTNSLEYVYAFFRHGIRSPLYKPYPTDPHKEEFFNLFKGKLGELTRAGKKQMYSVGKRLFKTYGKFIGGFSEDKVRASSTEMSRTIMTALSVMAGLFPPSKPLFKGLNWQPIPIWQDTADFDKVYFFNDPDFPKLAEEQCPRYGEMIRKGYDIVKAKDTTESRRKIYELIQAYTKRPDINSINTAYEINDILEFENLNGLPPPDWATTPQRSLNNKPLYPDLMRPLMVEWFFDCQWLNKNPEMLSFYSGPLFDSINDKFKDKITQKEKNQERFRFHETHDDTIYTLRWALGFDDPNFEVEPGDGIVFELHKKKVGAVDKHFVQVVYYHSIREESKFREVLQLRKCPSPCPYDTFSSLYPGMTPQEWEQKCKMPKIS